MNILNKIEIETRIAKLALLAEITELIKEDIALRKIDKANIPLLDYIYYSYNGSLTELQDYLTAFIEKIKTQSIDAITREVLDYSLVKSFFHCYEKPITDYKMEIILEKIFPSDFLVSIRALFTDIVNIDTPLNFDTLQQLHIPNPIIFNIAEILYLIIVGKIKKGERVTAYLFKDMPNKDSAFKCFLPKSIYAICNTDNGDYFVANDDIQSLDFKLSVLSLVDFSNLKNNLIFNSKLKKYLNVNAL